jgi:flagellar M-ring protein FliF
VEQLQQGIVKQVESLISPLVGQGNVRAEATADVDFAQVDTAAEMYKPNSPPEPQAIRSQQTSEASTPGTPPAVGIPGALSNQPPNVAAPAAAQNGAQGNAAPAGQAGAAQQPARHDATTNFEVDKTIRYEQKPMGGVKRLTVGVVVNYRRSTDPKTGKLVVTPLPPAVLAQINELVKQAMGYSQARGDTLNVTNAPFEGVDRPVEVPPKLDWYRDPGNIPTAINIGKYTALVLVIGFIYFRILSPLLRQGLRRFDEMTEVQEEPGPDEIEMQRRAMLEAELNEEQSAKLAKGYRSNLQMAKDLARDDPRVVANVVKTWVSANE